ncbi:unnamed protein product [Sphenostylis stenocarpa]|uniref:Uncharacterized protein n=1 Tax=Sphenostylis stenocarpa TaxID=92480 RepID=A0AA86SJK3_9FABA|nr:unnamed protein product [Sphenostylis stenocarpa]
MVLENSFHGLPSTIPVACCLSSLPCVCHHVLLVVIWLPHNHDAVPEHHSCITKDEVNCATNDAALCRTVRGLGRIECLGSPQNDGWRTLARSAWTLATTA